MSFNYSRKTLKTTRKHRCDWCGEPIEQGNAMMRNSGIFDGDFFSSKFHMECNAACSHAPFSDEGYYPHEFARGRTDDDRSQPPEFNEWGERVLSPIV
jgi:hypothetical protein